MKLNSSNIKLIKNIKLAQEQIKFAVTADQFLRNECTSMHRHVIQLNDDVIGFFKLDLNYSNVYDFCPDNALGLRTFVLDKSMQGQGLGTKAVKALTPYLKTHYANYSTIYLTVNCQNPAAQGCYLKAGFESLKERYLGGSAGPQYIMRKNIT
jgi:RimJ/RimL family protein N-acetyltransferase